MSRADDYTPGVWRQALAARQTFEPTQLDRTSQLPLQHVVGCTSRTALVAAPPKCLPSRLSLSPEPEVECKLQLQLHSLSVSVLPWS